MSERLHVSGGKMGLGVLVVTVLLPVVLFWVIPVYSEHRVFSQMEPEMREQFERWYHTRVAVEPEALRVAPFRTETLEAVCQLKAQLAVYEETLLTIKENLNFNPASLARGPEEIEPYRERIAAAQPLLDAFERVVRQPDYTIEVWFGPQCPEAGGRILAVNPQPLFQVLNLIYWNGRIKLMDQRIDETLEDAETLLKFVHNEPFSSLSLRAGICPLLALGGGKDLFRRAFPLLQDDARKQALLVCLEEQKARFQIQPPAGIDLIPLDQIGMTASARHMGFEPDFSGKNGFEVYTEFARVQSAYLSQCVAPAVSDARDRKEAQALAETTRQLYEQIVQSLHENRTGARRFHTKRHDRMLAASLFLSCCIEEERATRRMQAIVQEYDEFLKELKASVGPGEKASLAVRKSSEDRKQEPI